MSVDHLSGRVLGAYELHELLGRGGMGAVYRGVQSSLFREVAVKVVMPELAQQPGYIERFTREAKVAASLEHPHIVPVYDYGSENGITYVVMRLLSGGSLAQRLEKHETENAPLPRLSEVATLLKQLASALDYAHSEGVIHRDIKPNNVMFDSRGVPYIVDFGLAKLLDNQDALTRSGQTLGTPAYMPPEQWQAGAVTAASDQYALAVLIYEVLTGHQPFEANSLHQLIYMHLHQPPPSPDLWRDDVPAALCIVLEQAMAKDPERRFPTVTAFAEAFDQAIHTLPGITDTWTAASSASVSPETGTAPQSALQNASAVTASATPVTGATLPLPDTESPTVATTSKRPRWVWAVGAAALIGIAVVAFLLIGPRLSPTVAATPFPSDQIGVVLTDFERVGANARDDVERSLELRLETQGIPYIRVPETVTNAERARALSDQYNGTIVAWGSVAEGGMYVNFEITPRSSRVSELATFEDFAVDAKELDSFAAYIFSGMDGVLEYLVNFIQGQQLYYSGDYTAAIEAFNRAAGQISREQSEEIRADALFFFRANAHYALDNYSQAVLDYGRALEVNPEFAFAYGNRGNTYLRMSNYRDAVADFTRAIELDPEYFEAYSGRGFAYVSGERYADAVEDFNQAIEFDTEGILELVNYNGRGFAYFNMGDYESALADYNEITEQHPEDLTGWQGLALVQTSLGDHEAAIETYTKVLELDPENADAYQSRAISQAYLGNYEEAIADYTEAIERDPNNWIAYNGRAMVHGFSGHYDEAITDYTKALEHNPDNVASLGGRAAIYIEAGQPEQALPDLTAAIENGVASSPMGAMTFANRGQARFSLGEYDAALEDLDQAIELEPEYADAYHVRAWVYNTLGESERALADCDMAVSLWEQAVIEIDAPENGSVTETIREMGQHIHATVNAPAGAQLTVEAVAGEDAALDTILVIRDPSGEPLACNDDADESTLNSRIENIEVSEDGRYQLVAATVGGSGQGEVTLTVEVKAS